MLLIQPAQTADALDRALVADQAAQRIRRIGRIDDYPAGLDDLHGLLDQARLWILRVYLEELTHDISLFRGQQ
ncbi:hypothetical protein D3C81_2173000 [compost metagenome]